MNDSIIEAIEIPYNKETVSNKGIKQWEVLDSIVEKYTIEDISDITPSNFMDDEWEFSGSTSTIYWRKSLPSEEYLPLEVLLKLNLIMSIKYTNNTSMTFANRVRSFLINFVPLIKEMALPVLIAQRNQSWLRLDMIELSEISFMIQTLVQTTGATSSSGALNDIYRLSSLSDIKPFCHNLVLPWLIEDIYYEDWLDNLKASIGIEVLETKPYSALKNETVADLVNVVMPYLDGISSSNKPDVIFENEEAGQETYCDLLRHIKKMHSDLNISSAVSLTGHFSENHNILCLIDKHTEYFNMIDHVPEFHRVSKDSAHKWKSRISEYWFQSLFFNARNAAVWMILLTTGLRNSDLRDLKSEDLIYSHKYHIWFLKAALNKTKNIIYIPLGEHTVKAVKLLKWLGKDHSCPYLVQTKPFTVAKGIPSRKVTASKNYKKGDSINELLHRFASIHGIRLETVSDDDDEATCHCVRATLGAYIGSQSAMAILILKRLFGHSNNLMPDQYIRHNPLVNDLREKQLKQMHSQTARDIATSIVDKKISGPKADELLKGLSHLEEKVKLENDSLTEMDTHQKLIDILSEIILADIINEQSQTLLTPMGVICMRATNRTDSSPCAASTDALERDKAGVSRAMFNALPSLPNPAQCIGNGCPDALMTEKHSMPLLEQFDWYSNVLRNCTDPDRDMDEDAKHFMDLYYPIIMANDILTEASDFIQKYGKDLRVLYADEKPEGYFDA